VGDAILDGGFMTESFVVLALLCLTCVVTSYVATSLVRHAAEKAGLVDRPNERKHHEGAIPRIGGLAIIFGFGFPLLLMAGNARAAGLVMKNIPYLFAVLSSGALIIGLGLYDDLVGADAPKKFVVQTASAVILVSFGFQFDVLSFAGMSFDLGILGSVLSVIWIVGVINAMNLIDGLDSLATVIALTIAAAFAVIAVIRVDAFSLVLMVALAGSLAGFLPWNRPPARIFMGDTGSMFIGLMLAAISIAKPSKSPTAILIVGPMLALALPVFDTLMVMHERFRGEKVGLGDRIGRMFNADRRHIHHILVARHGSIGRAILSIWLVTLLFAAAAVLTVIDRTKPAGYAMAGAAVLVMLLIRYTKRPSHPLAANAGDER
jgi:UDP-GlcNAc:undecaprenyl-phosphate GlcNAc-1-phosphate transferase